MKDVSHSAHVGPYSPRLPCDTLDRRRTVVIGVDPRVIFMEGIVPEAFSLRNHASFAARIHIHYSMFSRYLLHVRATLATGFLNLPKQTSAILGYPDIVLEECCLVHKVTSG